MTDKTTILGMSLTAVFAIFAVSMTFATASIPDYLDIATPGEFTMEVTAEKIPHVTNSNGGNAQEGAVTFWSWVIANNGDSIEVAAVAIHHAFNDHSGNDQAVKSSPVQGFHPHTVTVSTAGDDQDFCVIGLTSPVWDFRVQDNIVTLNAEDETMTTVDLGEGDVDNITGWINPDDSCTATGLKVTGASTGLS